jgi:hypothetical protein
MDVPRKFIGVMGACTSGKTTISTAWRKSYREGENNKIIIFADPLKELAAEHGWSGKKDDEGRAFIQQFSNKYKAEHGDDVFRRIAFGNALKPALDGTAVIFEDVRFTEEIRGILKLAKDPLNSVALVYIYNHDAEQRWAKAYGDYLAGDDTCKWAVHESELEWRQYITTLHNEALTVHNSLEYDIESVVKDFNEVVELAFKREIALTV